MSESNEISDINDINMLLETEKQKNKTEISLNLWCRY